MEDLKAYIESGVLELYVLGDLTSSERLEVELMLEKHPELEAEISQIEAALENFADDNAIDPSAAMRSKILNELSAKEENASAEVPVIPISKARSNNFYQYAFAASIALLLLSLISIINLSSQLKESKNTIAVLQQSNQQFSSRVNFLDEKLASANQTLDVFQNPQQYKLVNLKGTPNAPTASMLVAFDPDKEVVMIDMGALKMPANDTEHQYQLWALVDGKPVDLGVFDAKSDSSGMVKMKSLKEAQAFAVTLEPKGGSATPTMEQMMAMGTI